MSTHQLDRFGRIIVASMKTDSRVGSRGDAAKGVVYARASVPPATNLLQQGLDEAAMVVGLGGAVVRDLKADPAVGIETLIRIITH